MFLNGVLRSARPVVVLDVDGTLVDSNDAHARAWVDAFTEAGVLVDHERVRRAIGMGGDKLMPHVSGIAEDSAQGAAISRRRSEIFTARYLPHLQPFPHACELVQRFLADGFTIVVASSAKDEELESLLERAGVSNLITTQTSSDDAERSKPDPDIVRAALGRASASGPAVMLGDTPYDVEAAHRAGIRIVGVQSGGWARSDLAGAVEVYADVGDLYERYEQSIFKRLAPVHRPERSRVIPRVHPGLSRLALVAAGLAALALLVVSVRARGRREPRIDEDELLQHRPGLGPRERERLRRIIERTS